MHSLLAMTPAPISNLPRPRWLLATVAVLAAGVAGWSLWARLAPEDPDPAALIEDISTVTALGRLEPEGETLQITAPTSAQESRIDQLRVAEGDVVAAGDIIAVLDNRSTLEAAVRQAAGQLSAARARLAQVQAGAKTGELAAQRAEINRLQADRTTRLAAQEAAIDRLTAEVENARVEAQRYATLYAQGAISASERDARQLTYTTAQQQLQQARSELDRISRTGADQIQQAEATLDQLAEVRPVDVAAAAAEVEVAIAALAEARAALARTEVRSPQAGQILKIHARPGETIGTDGIATLGQTQQMVVIAEVYQSDIDNIRPGQSATITSAAIAQPLSGQVERIGLQVEPQQVVDEDPAANIDARVVEVQIRLDAAASQQVDHLTNLQVTATIDTE